MKFDVTTLLIRLAGDAKRVTTGSPEDCSNMARKPFMMNAPTVHTETIIKLKTKLRVRFVMPSSK